MISDRRMEEGNSRTWPRFADTLENCVLTANVAMSISPRPAGFDSEIGKQVTQGDYR